MECLNIKKEEEYHFFYTPQSPQSLTIVDNKRTILANLYSLPSYYWIMSDKNQLISIQQQFQRKVGQDLNCCQTIEELKFKIQNYETIVIICQQSVLKKNIFKFQEEIKSKKITRIICIGQSFSNHLHCITFVNEYVNIFQQICQNKFSYSKANDFINFIFVSQEIQDSITLVKTMFAMLNQETDRTQMIKYMGEVAKVACPPYRIKEVEQFVKKNIEKQKRFSNTIKWYTKESFLYGFVNSVLRLCKDPTAIYVLQPYFKDLFQSISKLYLEQQKKKSDETHNYRNFTCYRGAAISEREVQQFKSNINSVVENLGFLSTSTQMEVANGFVINVLYQIEVHDDVRHSQLDFGFAFVDRYSSKSGEQEVIFNPLNTFKVLEVIEVQQDKPIYIIKLKYGQLARIVACHKGELSPEELKYKILGEYRISQKNKYHSIGEILIQNDLNLKGSKEYCEKYLQIALSSKKKSKICRGHHRLARYHQNKTEYQNSIQNYLKVLKLLKDKTESGDYYACLDKLGATYVKVGKFQMAVQYLQQSLKLYKKLVIDFMNPDYVIILNNLSVAYFNLGKYQQALKFLIEIQKIQIKISGNNNRYSLIILNNIGTVYRRLGLYSKAIQCLEEALYLQQVSLGEGHPICVKNYFNLAVAYFHCNQFSKSLPFFLKTEVLQKKYSGQYTEVYASTLKYLGITYGYLNQKKISQEYFQKFKKLYEGKPNFQREYSKMVIFLGKAYYWLGKNKQALQYLLEGQNIYKRVFCQNSMTYINILINLSKVLITLDQPDQSIETLLEAQFLQKKHFGRDNLQYSQILQILAKLYQGKGNISMALSCLILTKKIYKSFIDIKTNKIYPKILEQIGQLYMISHEFEKAKSYYEENLKIKKKICGQMHIEYFITLNNLGQCYKSCGQFKKSLSKFKQLQTISIRVFGPEHTKYAEILNSQASVHSSIGQFQIAAELYQRSLVILRLSLCQKHVLYLSTLSKLSVVLFDLGLYRQSMELCLKCGDEQLISKMTEILQKYIKIKSILSQYSLEIALILPPVKNVFSDIDQYMKNKNYNEAIKKIRWFRRICLSVNNPSINGLIEDFNRKQSEILNIIITQISNYYEIADNLQKKGHYQQAELIYSEFILMKYKTKAFVIPEVFRQIEDDLQYLKSRNKKQQEIIGVDTLAEVETEKFQFSYIDFQ